MDADKKDYPIWITQEDGSVKVFNNDELQRFLNYLNEISKERPYQNPTLLMSEEGQKEFHTAVQESIRKANGR